MRILCLLGCLWLAREAAAERRVGLGGGRWLRLEARQVHSSNGKGLVPENPAYDGLEVAAHLAVALAPLREHGGTLAAPDDVPLRPTRLELFLGARADGYSTLDDGGAIAGGVHASFELGLARRLAAQLEVLGGASSSGRAITAATARGYYRDDRTALGASLGTSAIDDRLAGESYGVFVERYEHPTLLASAAAGYERRRDADDQWFGELMLHLYPTDRLLLRAGFSYAKAELKQTRADILMHAEHAAFTIGGTTFAGYLQYGGNLLTRGSLGLVIYFDRESYARRERTRGVHGLRFK